MWICSAWSAVHGLCGLLYMVMVVSHTVFASFEILTALQTHLWLVTCVMCGFSLSIAYDSVEWYKASVRRNMLSSG